MSFSQDKYKDEKNDSKESPTSFDVPPFEFLDFDKPIQLYKHDEVAKNKKQTGDYVYYLVFIIVMICVDFIGPFYIGRTLDSKYMFIYWCAINFIGFGFSNFSIQTFRNIPFALMNYFKALNNNEIKDVPSILETEVRPLSVQDCWTLCLLMGLYLTQGLSFEILSLNAAFFLRSPNVLPPKYLLHMAIKLALSMETNYSFKIGKRKSWIVGTQLIIACMLLLIGWKIYYWGLLQFDFVYLIAFIMLLAISKAQYLAIQGWAISNLSKNALGYAYVNEKMCFQFSLFVTMSVIAMDELDFEIINMGTYISSIGGLNLLMAAVVIFIPENLTVYSVNDDEEVKSRDIIIPNDQTSDQTVIDKILNLYKSINFQKFVLLQILACFSFEAINLDSDMPKLKFPILLLLDIYVVWRSNSGSPLEFWRFHYWIGICYALFKQIFVWAFPKNKGVGTVFMIGSFILPMLELTCFSLQETIVHTFYLKLADPSIGSLEFALMLTIEPVIKIVCHTLVSILSSKISKSVCIDPYNITPFINEKFYYCSTEEMKAMCRGYGGKCEVVRNGYLYVNGLCIIFGLTLYFKWGRPTCKYLEKLPLSYWREENLN